MVQKAAAVEQRAAVKRATVAAHRAAAAAQRAAAERAAAAAERAAAAAHRAAADRAAVQRRGQKWEGRGRAVKRAAVQRAAVQGTSQHNRVFLESFCRNTAGLQQYFCLYPSWRKLFWFSQNMPC